MPTDSPGATEWRAIAEEVKKHFQSLPTAEKTALARDFLADVRPAAGNPSPGGVQIVFAGGSPQGLLDGRLGGGRLGDLFGRLWGRLPEETRDRLFDLLIEQLFSLLTNWLLGDDDQGEG